ncbi:MULTISPECIES: dihydrodipicolinate synthase family protein [unclassified Gordonia (in: high G+C Gram-positive bacteria)]|uniref:dihydrodipicolinate synthase family protein n=1 Tax=unclassified Gordonia (in: high G+C Gram-positive bacteria) TaxID=2657482 RepID=UPI0009AE78B4|nr:MULTISPECIES: dihydrodipicolinate synthase family protein [unclassified Gordonia (in: high G+C Gram-positive bacteria)]MDF3282982.1 dihydrodipicolinate synthase family protein [Gordonia sp. N1V]OPX10770.1 hypothetical protein B1964_23250 [Gordonia sp. i37]
MRVDTSDIRGVLAIIPTPATANASDPAAIDTVDHTETARAVSALIDDGVDAIMANGTLGEGATLTFDEHRDFAATVIETAAGRVPVFIGATTLNTRDTITRAKLFADMGASGLLLGRPMWSPCDDTATVGFYSDVARAVDDLAIVIYDNPVSFRGRISTQAYAQLAQIPQIVATKYPMMGPSFVADLAATEGTMAILPVERDWPTAWRLSEGTVQACWSGSASCGPAPAVALREAVSAADAGRIDEIGAQYQHAAQTFFPNGSFELFSRYNVQLEKIRINEAGYIAAGPARPPYTACPDDYAEGARESGRRLAQMHRLHSTDAGAVNAGSVQ